MDNFDQRPPPNEVEEVIRQWKENFPQTSGPSARPYSKGKFKKDLNGFNALIQLSFTQRTLIDLLKTLITVMMSTPSDHKIG